MKVLFPERIVDRHVGGNTTYARAVRDGIAARGIETGIIPARGSAVATMLAETAYGRRNKTDVLHYSADTGPLVRTAGPSLVTVHGVASRWIDVARSSRQEWVWRERVRRAIASTDALITVSESAADDIAEVFALDRGSITVIPHGMDTSAFSTRTPLSTELSAALPARFALYLGNIEPRKNLRELVRAFSTPEVVSLGLPLVIAGKPAWNFAEAMREIEAAPNVLHVGFVSDSDRIALMQACSLFVFPSLYEGFGLPVLEAMAAGAPTVSSRRGSLAEVAGPARTIEDLTAEGIAATVVSAATDASWLETATRTGPEWARRFRWSDSIDAHVRVYEKVAAR
ncbi:glycosyltransferase family 4 protein [Rathayibacter sp. VKM Ac-2856]|uniref:glycosyltransferase family 4 protein n=1 Tax=unclassified Rathayibacter TaxID=2609250 RepID=UPI0015668A4E|nr:glycosyltransferase family 4 protein [Rathayibacter sp. VKM Ac-2858]NQX19137.1 glycosyltransferase family 4 protein [Rathayibacter sp. VKM Ac-2856]